MKLISVTVVILCMKFIKLSNRLTLVDMKVNSDPSKQRCEGISRARGDAGENIGGKVVDLLGQLNEMLLSRAVVGEQYEIDTKNIKMFAKMASGEEAKQSMNLLNTGVVIDLPDHFCLENPDQGKCNAPVGISGIVYKINPRVSLEVFLSIIFFNSQMEYSLTVLRRTLFFLIANSRIEMVNQKELRIYLTQRHQVITKSKDCQISFSF